MAETFDELVRRTTTKKTRQRAAARTRELLGELLTLLAEHRRADPLTRPAADLSPWGRGGKDEGPEGS